MAKSKYTEQHIDEILEMYFNGKTSAEIMNYLNANYKLNASESSIRTIIQRNSVQQQDEAENQESMKYQGNINKQKKIMVKTMEELVEHEIQTRIAVNEFYQIKDKLGESSTLFSILNNEFGEAAATLRKRSKEKSPYLLFAGIWLLSLLFIGISGYYIGHCFYKNALLYGMNLIGIPGGIIVGLGIGLAININLKKKENATE